jgi:hypothetical protein
MPKIANRDAREYVQHKQEFEGSNLYGETLCSQGLPAIYVVYSYGTHFPMYIYEYLTESWYGNNDKRSRSTTKHQSQCSPTYDNDAITWLSTNDMKEVVFRRGITGIVRAPEGLAA